MNPKNKHCDGIPVVHSKRAEVFTEIHKDLAEPRNLVYAFEYKGQHHCDSSLYSHIYDNGGEAFYGAIHCDPTEIASRLGYVTGTVHETAMGKLTGADNFFTSGQQSNFPLGAWKQPWPP